MAHGFYALWWGFVTRTALVPAACRFAQFHRAMALPETWVRVRRSGDQSDHIDLSIIIPCYDYADFLEKAVASAAAIGLLEASPKIEIIVFEDRSRDKSNQLAQRLLTQSTLPFAVIRPAWNVGLSAARNIGLHHARGKYVFYLDADNEIIAEGVKNLFNFAETEGSDAAYGSIRCVLPDGSYTGDVSAGPLDIKRLREEGNYIDAMALFHKERLRACGGFDVNLLRCIGGWEDYELWLRLATLDYKVSFCPDYAIGSYLTKSDSMVHRISFKEIASALPRIGATLQVFGIERDAGLVFDLGFHLGEDTAYYLDLGYRVVAVEADPKLHQQGYDRFQNAIIDGRLVLLHAAVIGWERALGVQMMRFYPHATNTVWGSVDHAFVTRNTDVHKQPHEPAVEVKTTTLEQLVRAHGCPFFLKVDLEGMDAEVIEDIARLPTPPAYASWETGKKNLKRTLKTHLMLYFMGYGRYRIAQQANNPKKSYQQPKTGQQIQFAPHSSGPMPDTHPERWWGILPVLILQILMFGLYQLIGPASLWTWAEGGVPLIIRRPMKGIRAAMARKSIPFPGWFDTHVALSRSKTRR